MKFFISLFLAFLFLGCSKDTSVYWCGDHACINSKEKEAYFKKTMIVEKRELSKKNKESKSELEIIKKQSGLEDKKKVKNKKELAKQIRLDEKKRIKEAKKLPTNTDIAKIDVSSTEFHELVEKITNKNMSRSYPNINDIPN